MKKLISFVLICISTINFAYAHQGRTDSQGGHYDYENESGLGSYHFHHGYEAHLHENGICPYTLSAPTEPAEPQEPEQITETISEEKIDYSQFESLEEAYQAGYYYALYHEYSNLYEKDPFTSALNLGIATNLYFKNSEITYSDEVEDFTNEDAFIEGKVQGSDDLENTLSEYENSNFYTENEIYKAGYNSAAEKIETSGIEQASYQKGYKKGVNDTKKEFRTDEPDNPIVDVIVIIIFALDIIAIAFIIYMLQQILLRLYERYPSAITRAFMRIFTVLVVVTIIPCVIAWILSHFFDWKTERTKIYVEEEKQLLLKHYEMYKNGEYLPQIWEFEEFKKNGWSK